MKVRDPEPEDEEELKPAKGKSKPNEKPKKGAKPADEEGDPDKKPKKKGLNFKFDFGNKKMALGLGLAIVGVVVLGAAAYFILSGSPGGASGIKGSPFAKGTGPHPGPVGDKKIPDKAPDPKDSVKDGKDTKKDGEGPVVSIDLAAAGAGARRTSFRPIPSRSCVLT